MTYTAICDYCGNDRPFNLANVDALDFERTCVECGESICVSCVTRQGECTECYYKRIESA